MNKLSQYIKYIKDNPEGYWFKAKPYGYGWTPATREGFIVLGLFVIALLGNAFRLEYYYGSGDAFAIRVIYQTVILVGILTLIAVRTGEKPKWKWGIKKNMKLKDKE